MSTRGIDSGGKYGPEATAVRLVTSAQLVMLLVVGGNRGDGFSVQTLARSETENASALKQAAAQLRLVADAMEANARKLDG
jgi:hypothetical protein